MNRLGAGGLQPMNCDQARNLFDAYLDGELSPSLQTELGAHRVSCESCRHELALLEVAGDVIAADLNEEAGLDTAFTDRLLECVNVDGAKSGRPWILNRWLTGSMLAAAATIAIASLVWFSNPGGRVAGIKIKAEPIDEQEFDRTTESLVRQVETTWSGRARDAETVIEYGRMSLLRVFDRLQIEDGGEADGTIDDPADIPDDAAPEPEVDTARDVQTP